MKLPLSRCLLSVLITWWLLISTSFQYKVPLVQRPAPGPLGINLDWNLATLNAPPEDPSRPARSWFLSSRIRFNQPVSSITDGQLWQLVFDAHAEIGAALGQHGIGQRHMKIMTLTAFDHEIIFSSTLKGIAFVYDVGDTPVRDQLLLCQAEFHEETGFDDQHRNEGKCGEIMGAQLYYKAHPGTDISAIGARMATVMPMAGTGGRVDRRAPCAEPRNDRV